MPIVRRHTVLGTSTSMKDDTEISDFGETLRQELFKNRDLLHLGATRPTAGFHTTSTKTAWADSGVLRGFKLRGKADSATKSGALGSKNGATSAAGKAVKKCSSRSAISSVAGHYNASKLITYEVQQKNGPATPSIPLKMSPFYQLSYKSGVRIITDREPFEGIPTKELPDDRPRHPYVGFPFYLDEDRGFSKQSACIAYYRKGEPKLERATAGGVQRFEYYRPKCILSPSLFPNVPPFINFASHKNKGPHVPAPLHTALKFKLTGQAPSLIRRIVFNTGFRMVKYATDWNCIWSNHLKSSDFKTVRSFQKVNHMPGTYCVGRKDTIWRALHTNMRKFGHQEFGFMQMTYLVPEDLNRLRLMWPKNAARHTKWIIKPPAGARGSGIRLISKWDQFAKNRPLVVQKYIERPLLVNDNKFDLRIYVVLMSVNPLRIYMYKDGLARFAAEKYDPHLNNLHDRCMHLTNYSINKYSANYAKNENVCACDGHKWTLQSLWSCLEERGVHTKKLWATLRNLVIKTLISVEDVLQRSYKQNVKFRNNCYEVFGFDILLDENITPWLLEINISPSLNADTPLDQHVKGTLMQAVFNTALYQVPPTMDSAEQQHVLTELGLHGPLCYDKRIFTTCLSQMEQVKQSRFLDKTMEREDYLTDILKYLSADDVRCLILSEDELARSKPLERIFPTADTHQFLWFMESAHYYDRLLDAWEATYANNRQAGIRRLTALCEQGYHLVVPDETHAMENKMQLNQIDLLAEQQKLDAGGSVVLIDAAQSSSTETLVSSPVPAVVRRPGDKNAGAVAAAAKPKVNGLQAFSDITAPLMNVKNSTADKKKTRKSLRRSKRIFVKPSFKIKNRG